MTALTANVLFVAAVIAAPWVLARLFDRLTRSRSWR